MRGREEMMTKNTYQRPEIRTLRASEVVELLGPVSCGSNDKGDLSVGSASIAGRQHTGR
jgi:hypothetical protein